MAGKENVTHIIKIGNSSGIIIRKKLLQQVGILSNTDLLVTAYHGKIIIKPKFKSSKLKIHPAGDIQH